MISYLTVAALTAITAMVIGAAVLAVISARALIRQWRAARPVIQQAGGELDAPVPYWPAAEAEVLAAQAMFLAAICGPCRDRAGVCLCTVQCGDLACMGGFSDEDVEFLLGLSMPEGTDQ